MLKIVISNFQSRTPEIQGVFWMLVHCMSGALFSMCGRLLSSDYNIFQIVSLHSSSALIFMLIWINKDITKVLKTKILKTHILRVTVGFAGIIMWLYSIKYNPLVEATAITFLSPTIASVLAVLILKERASRHRIIALVLGFIGVLIVLRPGIDAIKLTALFPLAAAFIWGVLDLLIKKMSKTESVRTQSLYVGIFGFLLSLPLGFYYWKTPAIADLFTAFAMGFFAFGLIITIVKSLEKGEITFIIPFLYSSLIFNAIIAYFVFGESLDFMTFAGAIIIALASLNVIIKEKQSKKRLESDAIDAKP